MAELSREQQMEIMQFEQLRKQLGAIEAQKQQVRLQQAASKQALEELGKTKEEKAYRVIGSVLVSLEVSQLKKDLEEEVSKYDDNLKTLETQEKKTVDRMKGLKDKIEAAVKSAQGAVRPAGDATVGTA